MKNIKPQFQEVLSSKLNKQREIFINNNRNKITQAETNRKILRTVTKQRAIKIINRTKG